MRSLLDLVLPTSCAGCGLPGTIACPDCLAPLHRPAVLRWPRPAPPGMPAPYSVADYAGATRALLLAYKEEGAIGLQRPLGAALARAVAAVPGRAVTQPRGLMLVPVPSSRAARVARGDDVVARLARGAAVRLRRDGASVSVLAALRHGRAVRDSAGLTSAERARNLAGAFRLRAGAAPLVGGRLVVVVDDLVTTGATLAETAAVLRGAGATVVGAATVAATRRHPRDGHDGGAQSDPGALR